ncbi:MAG: hypothetical protein V1799_20750 [bacterium]
MKTYHRQRGVPRSVCVLLWCAAVLAFCGSLFSQQKYSGAEILGNVEKNWNAIQDYVADVEAAVDMERLRVPKMKAKLYFKTPDKIHIESPGFALLPREGLALNPKMLRSLYDITVVGTEMVESTQTFKLQLAAKDLKTMIRQMHLWVDPKNWTIMQMQTIPYGKRVTSLRFTYQLLEGQYWLPSMLRADFETSAEDTVQRKADEALPQQEKWEQTRQLPRKGSITVRYSNYKVNGGLSDELFKKNENQPERRRR